MYKYVYYYNKYTITNYLFSTGSGNPTQYPLISKLSFCHLSLQSTLYSNTPHPLPNTRRVLENTRRFLENTRRVLRKSRRVFGAGRNGGERAQKSTKKVEKMFGGLPNFSYLCTVKIKDISREKQAVGGWPMYSVAVSLIR